MSKKCTPLWREAHFQVKMLKNTRVRTFFGSSDVKKVHAVVARSTFPSQIRPPLEVQMCTLSKVSKTWGFCGILTTTTTTPHYTPIHYATLQLQLHNYTFTTFYYTTPHYTTLHSVCTQLHYITLHYITLHYTPLHYTTLHYTSRPSTTLRYITLHYAPQHYNYNYATTPHYAPLH